MDAARLNVYTNRQKTLLITLRQIFTDVCPPRLWQDSIVAVCRLGANLL